MRKKGLAFLTALLLLVEAPVLAVQAVDLGGATILSDEEAQQYSADDSDQVYEILPEEEGAEDALIIQEGSSDDSVFIGEEEEDVTDFPDAAADLTQEADEEKTDEGTEEDFVLEIESIEEVEEDEIPEELRDEDGIQTFATVVHSDVSGTVTNVSDLTPEATYNTTTQDYSNRYHNIYSYLEKVDGGYMRVEYTGTEIVVEYYDNNFQLTSKKYVACELENFSGFFAGSDAYYLVFDQENYGYDESLEVVRIVKYSKDWVRLNAAGLCGINTILFICGGALRMAEENGRLYVRTSHELYAGHQSNISFIIDESDMSLVDINDEISSVEYGYVSHSWNQFILIDDDENIVALDHGDSIPRGSILFRYNEKAGSDKIFSGYNNNTHINVFDFQGSGNYTSTGASLGDLEYSSSSYLVAGNSVTQDSNWGKHTARNIFVTATSRSDFSESGTTVRWITDYDTDGDVSATTPHLVKLGSDSFLLLWTTSQTTYATSNYAKTTELHYVFLDGYGNPTSEIYTVEGQLSECEPVSYNGSVTWYVTGDLDSSSVATGPVFYTISLDGTFSSSNTLEAPQVNVTILNGSIQLDWNEVPGADGYYLHYNTLTYLLDDPAKTTYTFSATDTYTYLVWVEAYAGTMKSPCSTKQKILYMRPPRGISVSSTEEGTSLSWTLSTEAAGTYIYRKTGDSDYVLVADTADTVWVDTDVSSGTEYTYQLYAYSDEWQSAGSSETYWTYFGPTVLRSVTNTTSGVELLCDTVESAERYYIYYKLSSSDSWSSRTITTVQDGVTQTLLLESKYLTSGESYDFYVEAATYAHSKVTYGVSSNILSQTYLGAPSVTASNTAKGIQLSWDAVEGAEGYRIARAKDGGTLENLTALTGTSWTDTSVSSGTNYTYQVRAYVGDTESGAAEKEICFLSLPTLQSVENGKSGIEVTWSTVSGAEKYRVYYKKSTDSSFGYSSVTAEEESTQSKTISATSGTSYDIYVTAVSGSSASAATETKSILYLKTPSLSFGKEANGFSLSWSEVTGAEGYQIYKKTDSGSFSLAKTTSGTSWTDTSVKSGSSYSYQVYTYSGSYRSCAAEGGPTVFVEAPTLLSVSSDNGLVTITWTTVQGATSYRLYYRTAGTSYLYYRNISPSEGSTQSLTLRFSREDTYSFYMVAYMDSDLSAHSETLSIEVSQDSSSSVSGGSSGSSSGGSSGSSGSKSSSSGSSSSGSSGSGSSTSGTTTLKKGSVYTVGGLNYQITALPKSGTGTVTAAGPSSAAITQAAIPAKVKIGGRNFKVTKIAAKAFKGCKYLKAVSVGKNVTTIGNQAFYGCTKMTKITIKTGLKKIGKKAFYGCSKLKKITIKSKNLTSIGAQAFKGIKSTATFVVPKSKLKAYKKLLKGKGVRSKMTITS